MQDFIPAKPRCILLQVISPHTHREDAIENLNELESLVKTYGGKVADRDIQHKVNPDPATYLGSGKIKKLEQIVKDKEIDVVILNDIVKTGQIFRLEKSLWESRLNIAVWDKADLILHIFDQHATTKEAKLQIELARIQHQGPRIYGLGGTYFSRQAGGIGTRGLGETNIELMQRHIKERTRKIRSELKKITKVKKKRIQQRRLKGVATVALVGYTNAGKTTLFNQFTNRKKRTRNSLFTTLDSVVGKLERQDSHREILVSDTIGFIDGLPPFLIDAFRSTLLESVQADLLLHIIDASDPELERKIEVVEKILLDLNGKLEKLMVFNKLDKITPEIVEKIGETYQEHPHLFISAQESHGLSELRASLEASLLYGNQKYTYQPYSRARYLRI